MGEHRALVQSDLGNATRTRVDWFVQLCGRLAFGDVTERMVLAAYDEVAATHRSQVESVSAFGSRLSTCVDEVGAALPRVAEESDDELRDILTTIPPAVILQADEPDVHFHLVCVTAAHSTMDGVDTPYLAARTWANMRVLRPAEDFGVTATGERLAIRYEDEPEAREEIDDEIRAELTRYLAAVPFDV